MLYQLSYTPAGSRGLYGLGGRLARTILGLGLADQRTATIKPDGFLMMS